MLQRRNAQPNYDIMVWAAAGYNGVVRLNDTDIQLTNAPGTELWYGTAPSIVTNMSYFLKHANVEQYNSTSVYIKKVKFGTGMYAKTSGLTNLWYAFACHNSDSSLISEIDVTNINTSGVTTMYSTFNRCGKDNPSGVSIIGIEDWDVFNVSTFQNMFNICRIKEGVVDLHKWHVKSGATITAMFGILSELAAEAINTCFYYTPGYWLTDPMSKSNSYMAPVVYPYHDITVAGTSSYAGGARFNGGNKTLTKDNTLNIWYYDIPSDGELYDIQAIVRNQTEVLSVSFKKDIKLRDTGIDCFQTMSSASSLRTFEFPSEMKLSGAFNEFAQYSGSTSSTVLTGLYGPEKIISLASSITGGRSMCSMQAGLRYFPFDFSQITCETYITNAFDGCTNLIRIKGLPGVANGCATTNAFRNCSALTTIDACGPISETIDMSAAPLNLASAKVVLTQLQTVTSKTITFSSTTLNYIFQDDDALELVRQAKLKGWNVANTNRLITGTVASGVTSIKLRINNDSSKDVTVTCTNGRFAYNVTESITTIRNILSQSSGQITSIDFSNCDLSTCTAAINTFLNQTVLTKISLRGCNVSNVTNWQGCFATNTGTSAIQEIDFRGCTFSSSVTNVNYLFMAATSLTTFLTDEDTHINQNWDMSPCSSLSLQSAKNVLSALGSVSKTASFHANTQDKIAGDYEAKMLLAQARQRGWTIAVASTIRGTVTSSTSSISLKINGSSISVSCSEGAFTYRTTNTITSLNQFLYNNRTILTIDMHQMDLYSCTNMGDMFNTAMSLTSAIVKELDTRNVTTMYAMFNYCPPLASLDVSKLDTRSVTNFTYFCGYNGNVTNLSELPAIYSGADTSNMFVSCGGLVSIDSVGEGGIAATLDMSSCPLSLASAKVILNALQTVTSETLTFSSTTIGYINADSEALSLVTEARNKGWTISLS